MLSSEELDWLKVALKETDDLLRGLADFRQYSDLLNRADPQVEALLEHIVTSVRDARLINSKVLARVEDAHGQAAELARQAAEEEARKTREPEPPPPPRLYQPPD